MEKKKKLKTFFRTGTFKQWYRSARKPLDDSRKLTDEAMKKSMARLAMVCIAWL